MMAAPVAVIVGAPVSEGLLHLDGWFGLRGWQWLFLVEGLPAVVLGVLALLVLTDRPDQAAWLTADERRSLTAMLDEERRTAPPGHASLAGSLTSGRVWLLSVIFFMNSVANYGIFLWLPKLVRDVAGTTGLTQILATSIPFVIGMAAMIVVGRHSDRSGERRLHVVACVLTAAAGLIVAVVFQNSLWLLTAGFTLSQIGFRSFAGIFWAIPPQILSRTGAAAGIALINSIGGLGGFVGPTLVGTIYDATGGYTGGLLALTVALLVEAALMLALRLSPRPAVALAH
jgi:nitrate/nitrite transporter NarK